MDFATAQRLVTSPQTTAQELTDICNAFPELRASAAIHPNAHPELLAWLARLGDPAVNAALATRAARQQPQKEGGGTGWIWALVVIVVAVLAVLVWWMMTGDDDPGTTPTETTEPAITDEATDLPTEEEPTDDGETTAPETETETDPDALGTISELFPDPGFAECIAGRVHKGVEETVTSTDLAEIADTGYFSNWGDAFGDDGLIPIESPKLRCEGVANLEGVQLLESLATLSIQAASDIPTLDLTPLAQNESLSLLEIQGYNPDGFTSDHELDLDFSPLADLPSLKALRVTSLTTDSLDTIGDLSHLQYLLIADVKGVSDFDFLRQLDELAIFGAPRLDPSFSRDLIAELRARGVDAYTDID